MFFSTKTKAKLTLGQLGLTTGWLAQNGGARAALDDGGGMGEDDAGVSTILGREEFQGDDSVTNAIHT